MPHYRNRSGSGDPEHFIADYEFEALSQALGVDFSASDRERLQRALNEALYWGSLEFNADAQPILDHYDALEKHLRKLKELLDKGPKTEDSDALFMMAYAYDRNRQYKYLRLEWSRLPLVIGQMAGDIARAKKATIKFHTTPKLRHRSAPPGLDRLVHRMADFSESVGVTPNAAYSPDKDSAPRRTPFVEFIDALRKMIGDKLPNSQASSESIVRRIDDLRRTRRTMRAASANADRASGTASKELESPARDQATEEDFFESVFGDGQSSE